MAQCREILPKVVLHFQLCTGSVTPIVFQRFLCSLEEEETPVPTDRRRRGGLRVASSGEILYKHCSVVLARKFLTEDPFASDMLRMEWAVTAAVHYRQASTIPNMCGLTKEESTQASFNSVFFARICCLC